MIYNELSDFFLFQNKYTNKENVTEDTLNPDKENKQGINKMWKQNSFIHNSLFRLIGLHVNMHVHAYTLILNHHSGTWWYRAAPKPKQNNILSK